MQISQDSALLFCWQFTMWRPHLLAAEQRTRCQLYPSSWALVTCHNIVLHKPQHSSLTAKRADQYGYKQLAIGSLMFDALTLFARTCLKLMAAQGKPWAVLFPCCRQISELDIMCKNCSMVEDFKPHITFGNNIQTKQVSKRHAVDSVFMSHSFVMLHEHYARHLATFRYQTRRTDRCLATIKFVMWICCVY